MIAMPRRVTRRRFLVEVTATTALVGLGCQRGHRGHRDVREVERLVDATPSRDGAGVKLRRALGAAALPMLDPFLLLDEIHSDRQEDFAAGFPTHPHRGFETVSYLIAGAFEHADSVGNRGVIGAGDCQWMTAGRGIVHSEMPRAAPGEELWGLQLWVNLPAARKMTAPRYQDMPASAIPAIELGDARVRIAAGAVGRARGPIDGIAVAPTLLEITLPAGGAVRHELPVDHTAFAYALAGEVQLGARAATARAGQLAVLGRGRELAASSDTGGRFLLIAGTPIGEPVARRGPFVMNTDAELRQAFDDYRAGRLTRP